MVAMVNELSPTAPPSEEPARDCGKVRLLTFFGISILLELNCADCSCSINILYAPQYIGGGGRGEGVSMLRLFDTASAVECILPKTETVFNQSSFGCPSCHHSLMQVTDFHPAMILRTKAMLMQALSQTRQAVSVAIFMQLHRRRKQSQC